MHDLRRELAEEEPTLPIWRQGFGVDQAHEIHVTPAWTKPKPDVLTG